MSDSTIGYGAFELQDLVSGEEFFAQDGTPGKVAGEQRLWPEYVEVFLGESTETSLRLARPPSMRVFGTSLDQARRIARRVAQRRRRAQEKGGHP